MHSKPLSRSVFFNVLGYQSLQSVLRSYGLETSQLDNLLSVMGTEKTLERLLSVLDCFHEVANLAKDVLPDNSKWVKISDRISQANRTALFITKNKSIFRRHLHRPEIIEHNRNSVLKLLIKYGHLYATLGYTPKEPSDNIRLRLLLTQILCQHLLTRQKNTSEHTHKLFAAALRAVRTLTTSEHLKHYPSSACHPEEYPSLLLDLPNHTQRNTILTFLNEALVLTKTISLKKLSTSVLEEKQKDPLDAFYKKPENLSENEKCVEAIEEILNDKYYEDDPPETTGLFFGFTKKISIDQNNSVRDLTSRIAKSRSIENQLFHFSWNNLNSHELQCLIKSIFSNNEELPLISRVALGLMLFCGLDSERIASLGLATTAPPKVPRETYIRPSRSLRVRSHGPTYKTPLIQEAIKQATPKQTFIDLAIPEKLANLIEMLPAPQHSSPDQQRLLESSHANINSQCASALSILKKKYSKRITLNRIQSYLDRRLAMQPENDLAGACLTLGKEKYLARTRIHYSSFDQGNLDALYRKTCNCILNESGLNVSNNDPYPSATIAHVGTPIRPKFETVQNLISNIKKTLQRFAPNNELQLIEWHNTYVLYVTLFIAYTTGYRANISPYISADMYDEISGFCVIADKTSRDMYHSRLVWLTESCRKQLEFFRAHVQNIYKYANKSVPLTDGIDGEFFFLSETGHRQTATRKIIVKHLRRFGYYLPPNTQRHLLKSELQENGCPSEAIEALLGHWHIGEEAWTKTSGLNPTDYKRVLIHQLPPLTRRLGLTPYRGITTSASKKSGFLPLHIPTTREKKAHHRRKFSKTANRFFQQKPAPLAWIELCGSIFAVGTNPQFPLSKKNEATVLIKMFNLLPELYRGEKNVLVDQTKLQKLIKRLKPNTKPADPRAHYKRVNYLIRVLEWGKENLNWKVEVPPKPTIQPHGRNLAKPSLIRQMRVFREVESAFLTDIKTTKAHDTLHAMGQILLSAILFGNLHHRTWAEAFFTGIRSSIFLHDHLLWADLWTTPADKIKEVEKYRRQRNPNIYRRWIADPTTQVLLLRLLQNQGNAPKNLPAVSLGTLYKRYQKTLKERTGAKLPSLDKVLFAARAFSTLSKPPFLVVYGANQLASSNLPDPAWIRLLSQNALPSKRHAGGRRNLLVTADSPEELKRQKRYLKEIRHLIRSRATTSNGQENVATEIDQYLDTSDKQLAHCVYLLGDWARSLLREQQTDLEKRNKPAEAISTVESYISSFCDDFLIEAIEVDLDEMTTEEFCILLEKVTSRIWKARQKENWDATQRIEWICGRLNQFLVHISLYHNTPEVSVEFKDGRLRTHAGLEVRSNYIHPNEYRALLKKLGWGCTKLPRKEKIILVIVILAYRTGIRPAEIWGSLIGDFVGDENLELLVQRNVHRDLKSAASLRRLPLYILLPKEELDLVHSFLQFRRSELGTKTDSPFITADPFDMQPIPRQLLFAPIKTALCELLGDETLVIYSMRHSFACNLLIRLLLRQDIPREIRPDFLCDKDFEISTCTKLRTDLLENESLGRKALFAVATLLGHSDTSIELRSYFHFCDVLQWYYANSTEALPHLDAEALMSLTGFGRSAAFGRLKKPQPLLDSLVKLARKSSTALAHPLAKNIKGYNFEASKIIPTNLNPLDQTLYKLKDSTLPKGLNWPKDRTEYQILKELYQRAEQNLQEHNLPVPETASFLLEGYKHYDGTFLMIDHTQGGQILGLLESIGLSADQLILRHSPSRWNLLVRSASKAEWERALNVQLLDGNKYCGRNIEHGSVQIEAVEIYAMGNLITFDKKLSNLLAICLYLLTNQLPGRSIDSSTECA